jgi:hypothetical protein
MNRAMQSMRAASPLSVVDGRSRATATNSPSRTRLRTMRRRQFSSPLLLRALCAAACACVALSAPTLDSIYPDRLWASGGEKFIISGSDFTNNNVGVRIQHEEEVINSIDINDCTTTGNTQLSCTMPEWPFFGGVMRVYLLVDGANLLSYPADFVDVYVMPEWFSVSQTWALVDPQATLAIEGSGFIEGGQYLCMWENEDGSETLMSDPTPAVSANSVACTVPDFTEAFGPTATVKMLLFYLGAPEWVLVGYQGIPFNFEFGAVAYSWNMLTPGAISGSLGEEVVVQGFFDDSLAYTITFSRGPESVISRNCAVQLGTTIVCQTPLLGDTFSSGELTVEVKGAGTIVPFFGQPDGDKISMLPSFSGVQPNSLPATGGLVTIAGAGFTAGVSYECVWMLPNGGGFDDISTAVATVATSLTSLTCFSPLWTQTASQDVLFSLRLGGTDIAAPLPFEYTEVFSGVVVDSSNPPGTPAEIEATMAVGGGFDLGVDYTCKWLAGSDEVESAPVKPTDTSTIMCDPPANLASAFAGKKNVLIALYKEGIEVAGDGPFSAMVPVAMEWDEFYPVVGPSSGGTTVTFLGKGFYPPSTAGYACYFYAISKPSLGLFSAPVSAYLTDRLECETPEWKIVPAEAIMVDLYYDGEVVVSNAPEAKSVFGYYGTYNPVSRQTWAIGGEEVVVTGHGFDPSDDSYKCVFVSATFAPNGLQSDAVAPSANDELTCLAPPWGLLYPGGADDVVLSVIRGKAPVFKTLYPSSPDQAFTFFAEVWSDVSTDLEFGTLDPVGGTVVTFEGFGYGGGEVSTYTCEFNAQGFPAVLVEAEIVDVTAVQCTAPPDTFEGAVVYAMVMKDTAPIPSADMGPDGTLDVTLHNYNIATWPTLHYGSVWYNFSTVANVDTRGVLGSEPLLFETMELVEAESYQCLFTMNGEIRRTTATISSGEASCATPGNFVSGGVATVQLIKAAGDLEIFGSRQATATIFGKKEILEKDANGNPVIRLPINAIISEVSPNGAADGTLPILPITAISVAGEGFNKDLEYFCEWLTPKEVQKDESSDKDLEAKLKTEAVVKGPGLLECNSPGEEGLFTLQVSGAIYEGGADGVVFAFGSFWTSVSPEEGSARGGELLSVLGGGLDEKEYTCHFGPLSSIAVPGSAMGAYQSLECVTPPFGKTYAAETVDFSLSAVSTGDVIPLMGGLTNGTFTFLEQWGIFKPSGNPAPSGAVNLEVEGSGFDDSDKGYFCAFQISDDASCKLPPEKNQPSWLTFVDKACFTTFKAPVSSSTLLSCDVDESFLLGGSQARRRLQSTAPFHLLRQIEGYEGLADLPRFDNLKPSGELPAAAPGYWRSPAGLDDPSNIVEFPFYECEMPRACLGGILSLCRTGHAYGDPLCGVCETGYYESSNDGLCTECQGGERGKWAAVAIVIFLALIVSFGACLHVSHTAVDEAVKIDPILCPPLVPAKIAESGLTPQPGEGVSPISRSHIRDSWNASSASSSQLPIFLRTLQGKGLIIIEYTQILGSFLWGQVYTTPWPANMNGLLSLSSFINLDLMSIPGIALTCNKADGAFYQMWIAAITVPAALVTLFALINRLIGPHLSEQHADDTVSIPTARGGPDAVRVQRLRFSAACWRAALWCCIALYSGVSRTIVKAFQCTDIDGEAFLTADLSQKCSGRTYSTVYAFSVIFTLLYVIGFPLWLLLLLHRKRHDPKWVMRFSFLVVPFKSSKWMWFPFTLMYNTLLTDVLMFIDRGGVAQAALGMVMLLLGLATLVVQRPFRLGSDFLAAISAHSCLFITSVAGLAQVANGGYGERGMGSFLLFIHVMFFILFGVLLLYELKPVKESLSAGLSRLGLDPSQLDAKQPSSDELSGDVLPTMFAYSTQDRFVVKKTPGPSASPSPSPLRFEVGGLEDAFDYDDAEGFSPEGGMRSTPARSSKVMWNTGSGKRKAPLSARAAAAAAAAAGSFAAMAGLSKKVERRASQGQPMSLAEALHHVDTPEGESALQEANPRDLEPLEHKSLSQALSEADTQARLEGEREGDVNQPRWSRANPTPRYNPSIPFASESESDGTPRAAQNAPQTSLNNPEGFMDLDDEEDDSIYLSAKPQRRQGTDGEEEEQEVDLSLSAGDDFFDVDDEE